MTQVATGDSAVAIVAALPRELARLARDLGATTVCNQAGLRLQSAVTGAGQMPILLVTAGMGSERVALAVAKALAHGPIGLLLSVGLAGGCDPGLHPGDLVAASVVIDSRSGERYSCHPVFTRISPGVLVTSPEIAGSQEKRRLHQSYAAAAVDMEAATVARLAEAHGIPFAALKAISDEHHVDLSHLSGFADARGHFRTGAFALRTLVSPQRWRSTAALGRHGKLGLAGLTAALLELIQSRGGIGERL